MKLSVCSLSIANSNGEHMFSTNGHPHGSKLCSSPCPYIPLRIWGRVYTATYQRQKSAGGSTFILTLCQLDSINIPQK
jgi:hypothetical protein